MYIRRLILLLTLFSLFSYNQVVSQQLISLTQEEVAEYTEQSKQLVMYLEGTLNFIGDPKNVPSDKDIIISDSYLKMFRNDEVQVEDDLDPNRDMAMNKDVQAYLKDVDFFFNEVSFAFEITGVEQLMNEKGDVVFKVTLNRNLKGITLDYDTLDNNLIRYIEINLNPVQKDLRIASIYTTKPDMREELKYWWENMAMSWKEYFGDPIIITDTIPFSKIITFSDSTLIFNKWEEDIRVDTMIAYAGDTLRPGMFTDSMVYLVGDTVLVSTTHFVNSFDTLAVNGETIYSRLKQFVSAEVIDISGETKFRNLDPLIQLTNLKEINFSNTPVKDLTPLRNLNKLEKIDCSGSAVTSLDQLRYSSNLKELICSNTGLTDITVVANLRNLKKLSIGNNKIQSLKPISALGKLNQLDLAGIPVSDFSEINTLSHLSDLNISNTNVTGLSSLSTMTGIRTLYIDSTAVSDLSPLSKLVNLTTLHANHTKIESLDPLIELESIKYIYCDNTGIDDDKSNVFMEKKPNSLVIFNTINLEEWWENMPVVYKDLVMYRLEFIYPITTEQLHEIINQTSIDLSGNKKIDNIEPFSMMHRLEKVNLENTNIDNIESLSRLSNLRELNINSTAVTSLESLENMQSLEVLKCDNTVIDDLIPLTNNASLTVVYCDNTKVEQENVLRLQDSIPGCMVIYQTEYLMSWWKDQDETWQYVFNQLMDFKDDYGRENLHRLTNKRSIVIKDNKSVRDLRPLTIFMRLESLTVSNTSVDGITAITSLPKLIELNVPNNPISGITSITRANKLEQLNLENTSVDDLSPISQLASLKSLNIAGTRIKNLKGIETLAKLEKLVINNTDVKNLKPLEKLPGLKELKCYRTGISEKNIEKYKGGNPEVDVAYY